MPLEGKGARPLHNCAFTILVHEKKLGLCPLFFISAVLCSVRIRRRRVRWVWTETEPTNIHFSSPPLLQRGSNRTGVNCEQKKGELTTDSTSEWGPNVQRGEVALTTDGTSPATGFTPHYRSSLKSQAP